MFHGVRGEEDGAVETSRAVARRADDLVRRCSSGLRGAAFQAEVVRTIHALLPVDVVFLATADPETLLLTSIFAEEPLAHVADQFFDNEFGQVDVNKFQSLATGARHVATLDSATHGDRAGSARYREIMTPLGLGDELRAALVTPSGCWGYVCLHRAESRYGFTPAEVRLISRLATSIGDGCRLSLAAPGTEGIAAIAPGVVVLHPDHTVAAITGEADCLLADIADYSATRGASPPPSTRQPPACRTLTVEWLCQMPYQQFAYAPQWANGCWSTRHIFMAQRMATSPSSSSRLTRAALRRWSYARMDSLRGNAT
jgi:hypothetical protein